MMRRLALAAIAAFALAACAQDRLPQPDVTMRKPEPLVKVPVDDSGTGLVGPAGGAMLGMAIGTGGGTEWAVAAGAALGYAVGGSEGPQLSGLPAQARTEAIAKMMTVPLRTQVTWFTASEKASGKITPTREFTDERGRTCRDFVEWRTLRATNGHTSGTACL
jgi:surface antigen